MPRTPNATLVALAPSPQDKKARAQLRPGRPHWPPRVGKLQWLGLPHPVQGQAVAPRLITPGKRGQQRQAGP